MLKAGLIINPYAGIGGPVALKGSDGAAIREQALASGSVPRAGERAARALAACDAAVAWLTCAADMGARICEQTGTNARSVYAAANTPSEASDTRNAAQALCEAGVELLVFAGGDGTARDVLDAVGGRVPVIGIPAGVKMHSGVFAVSPEAAGEMIAQLAAGGVVGLRAAEIRDIDEAALREGRIRSRFYGELLVPVEAQYLQHVKESGRESEPLVQYEIASWLAEQLTPNTLCLVGPGTTACALLDYLNLPHSVMGVDVLHHGAVIAADANEARLLQLLDAHTGPVKLVLGITGGQGFVLGRGNQMLSAAVIRKIGRANIVLVSAKSKLSALNGRALQVDTGDIELDKSLAGLWPVVSGYDERVLYRVG
ncbi:MAG TPA: ATP-NAD kinase family protein [Pseudomonadales bacterium]